MVVFLSSVCCKILTNVRHYKNFIIKLGNLSINYYQQQKYLGTKYCERQPTTRPLKPDQKALSFSAKTAM